MKKLKAFPVTGGTVFCSEESPKEGDTCIDSEGKIFTHENHFPISIGQRKIIAQSETLSLPGIPFVEIEDEAERMADKYIEKVYAGVPILDFRDEERKRLSRHLYIEAVNDFLSKTKKGFTEEDVRFAIENAFAAGSAHNSESYNEATPYVVSLQNSLIASFRPKLSEIEVTDETYIIGSKEYLVVKKYIYDV